MTISNIKLNYFLFLYIPVVLLDLALGSSPYSHFRLFTKPLILLSLFLYFVIYGKLSSRLTYGLMLMALFFSFLGDVFLLFEHKSGNYFMLGLISFLLAHILFTLTFIKKWNTKVPLNFWWIVLLLLSYGTFLFYILKDSLSLLKIPVLFYILGILAMVITAYRRKGKVPQSSFNLVFIGALFFVLSDSVLAINKFMFAVPLSHIVIMGTYATAQYLITKGILTQGDFGN